MKSLLQENSEILSRCIKENLGFKDGKPVAACVIYRCLLHWHAFESERTAIFDFIIAGINEVLKVISLMSLGVKDFLIFKFCLALSNYLMLHYVVLNQVMRKCIFSDCSRFKVTFILIVCFCAFGYHVMSKSLDQLFSFCGHYL